jgi:hypothetical protein
MSDDGQPCIAALLLGPEVVNKIITGPPVPGRNSGTTRSPNVSTVSRLYELGRLSPSDVEATGFNIAELGDFQKLFDSGRMNRRMLEQLREILRKEAA